MQSLKHSHEKRDKCIHIHTCSYIHAMTTIITTTLSLLSSPLLYLYYHHHYSIIGVGTIASGRVSHGCPTFCSGNIYVHVHAHMQFYCLTIQPFHGPCFLQLVSHCTTFAYWTEVSCTVPLRLLHAYGDQCTK